MNSCYNIASVRLNAKQISTVDRYSILPFHTTACNLFGYYMAGQQFSNKYLMVFHTMAYWISFGCSALASTCSDTSDQSLSMYKN